MKTITVTLRDTSDRVSVGEENLKVDILIPESLKDMQQIIVRCARVDTWNDAPQEAEPIMIEFYRHKLRLMAWTEEQEDPVAQVEWDMVYPPKED